MRGTPTLFLPDLEWGGINHAVLEIIANSNDELIAYPHPNAKLQVVLCKDTARNTFQWIIKDTGRGIPFMVSPNGRSVFVDCLTKPHTSGKFNQNSYAISAGQFGVGLKAATAMSYVLRCITHRPDGTASLTVHEGKHDKLPLIDMAYHTDTGTTTVCEPDSSIFAGVETYAEQGYTLTLSLLRQMVFFRSRNIEFRVSETPVDPAFWDESDIRKADAYINEKIASAELIWSALTNDPKEWIKSYWNLHKPFSWEADVAMTQEEKEAYAQTPALERLRDVVIKLYMCKGDRSGGVFALVNSVTIPDRSSDHVAQVSKALKDAIVDRLDSEAKKKFFMDSYTLPLFYAINVDYKGAKFSNAQKTAFKEVEFREIYADLLHQWFMGEGRAHGIVDSLYEQIREDIETRYLDSLGSSTKRADTSRVWTRLNKPKNFIDAENSYRSECALFLLE